jgi:hypothetical protein
LNFLQIFFTRGVDNDIMGKKTNEGRFQQSIVFEKWMADAIKEIAQEKGLTFTAVVTDLLRQELAVMGYTLGIGREAEEDLQASRARAIEKRAN